MHIFDNPTPIGPLVSDVARALIANTPLTKQHRSIDHEFAGVIKKFAVGADGEQAARRLLMAMREGFENFSLSHYDLNESLATLFRAQPRLALDMLVGDKPNNDRAYARRHLLAGGHRSSALAQIPIEALVQWCRDGSPDRWAHVAPLVPAFAPGEPSEGPRWSERVLSLLQYAPEPAKVAGRLVELIEPMSWSGSHAEAIRQRLPLLDELAQALGPEHADEVAGWRSQVMLRLNREVRRELEEHRARNERFE